MVYDDPREDEPWRVYTKRLAKLNNTSRRRVLRQLRKRARQAS